MDLESLVVGIIDWFGLVLVVSSVGGLHSFQVAAGIVVVCDFEVDKNKCVFTRSV